MRPSFSRDTSEREADAIVNMMGADSRRIDGLVETVGEVRGDITHLRGDMSRVAKGVDDLKDAMVGVARHTVVMESYREALDDMRKHQETTDGRIVAIEREMPGLIETRTYTVRAVVAVAALVGVAIVAMVIKATP